MPFPIVLYKVHMRSSLWDFDTITVGTGFCNEHIYLLFSCLPLLSAHSKKPARKNPIRKAGKCAILRLIGDESKGISSINHHEFRKNLKELLLLAVMKAKSCKGFTESAVTNLSGLSK